MSEHTPFRILVIANESIDGSRAAHAASGCASEVLVVAPALSSRLRFWVSDVDPARRRAERRLDLSLRGLVRRADRGGRRDRRRRAAAGDRRRPPRLPGRRDRARDALGGRGALGRARPGRAGARSLRAATRSSTSSPARGVCTSRLEPQSGSVSTHFACRRGGPVLAHPAARDPVQRVPRPRQDQRERRGARGRGSARRTSGSRARAARSRAGSACRARRTRGRSR